MRFDPDTLAEWPAPTAFPPPYGRHSSWWSLVKRDGYPDVLAEKEDNNSCATFIAANSRTGQSVYGSCPGGRGVELFYEDNEYLDGDEILGLVACLLAAREEMESFEAPKWTAEQIEQAKIAGAELARSIQWE